MSSSSLLLPLPPRIQYWNGALACAIYNAQWAKRTRHDRALCMYARCRTMTASFFVAGDKLQARLHTRHDTERSSDMRIGLYYTMCSRFTFLCTMSAHARFLFLNARATNKRATQRMQNTHARRLWSMCMRVRCRWLCRCANAKRTTLQKQRMHTN